MIDFLIKQIVDYLEGSLVVFHNEKENERKSRSRLLDLIKHFFDKEMFGDEMKHMIAEDLSDLIKRLTEIRFSYLKGNSFVENQKKGSKKKFIKSIDYIENEQQAIEHLEFIKKYRNERTYYRHKKIIKQKHPDFKF